MELWERSEALDRLSGLLRESARGGRIALLAGEAGIGKSALVGEFVRRCGSTARVVRGACDRLVTPRALGPLHDIGGQLGGRLAAQLRSAAAPEDLYRAFLEELSSGRIRQPQVVVVEDAHWADEATLDWLAFLGRRIDRLPVLLVVTYRSDEVGPDHPLRGVLATLPHAVVRRVPIEPLSTDCVREQARRAGRDGGSVYALAGGNPLLVTELLKATSHPVPGAVQDLILDRIRALPPAARALAQLVAVVPTRAEPFLLPDNDAVEVGLAAGVLVPSGDGVSFRHELFRSAVEESLSPLRRAELHRQVLRALVARPDADPGRVVHHAWLAGDHEAVLRFGRIAGRAAARQGAHREAARHYRAAAAYAERLPDADQAELLEAYADEAHLAAANEEALRAREQALTIRQRLGDAERIAEDLRWVSQLSWWTGRADRTWEAADQALAVLAGLPPSRALAMAYVAQAQLRYRVNQLAASAEWADRAVEVARGLGEQEIALHAAVTRDTARLAAGDLTAWASLEQLHQEARDAGLVDPAARALGSLATVAADELARYAEAETLVDRSLAFSAEHHLDGLYLPILAARATLRLERGSWDGALSDAESVLAHGGGATGVSAVLALVAQGRVLGARGEPDAEAVLDRAARAAEGVGDVSMLVPVADARSEYFLWVGDRERAQREARRGLDSVGWSGGPPFVVGRLGWRLWRAGGPERPTPIAGPYQRMIDGDWAGAAAAWAERGADYLRIEALAAGDQESGAAALRQLDGLGATRAAGYVRASLRRRGFAHLPRGPRRATAGNVAGLTPRQVEVLRLVTEGLSNAEIAARLTLSPKTVDHHVSALLDKLGVASRGQAAAAAHRLGLGPDAT